jgi:hypothetical protein
MPCLWRCVLSFTTWRQGPIPAGTVRENISLKDENRQLRVALAEARDLFVAGEKGENGGIS